MDVFELNDDRKLVSGACFWSNMVTTSWSCESFDLVRSRERERERERPIERESQREIKKGLEREIDSQISR